jgi:nitroreductase
MLLQLAAINEGLAAGFDSPADPDELLALGRLVHLPDDVATIGVLTIGYSAEDPTTRNARLAQRRKPIDELVRWQRY